MRKIKISVDLASCGRTFEGIGGISSNGTSKLLRDYPEKQQGDIIDLLFKPDFGAGFQQLKIEIGSDANTSSGTEPSHMRFPDDYIILRGTGLWLAREAKKRNPALRLSALRWGTPAWITDYNQKWEYYYRFLQGAKDTFGLYFDYIGADMNEGEFDRNWTVFLRRQLNIHGFAQTGIVAADSENDWFIADMVQKDTELKDSLCALGIHYTQQSSANALESGLPLWLSEDIAPLHSSFKNGPLLTARRMMLMYIRGKMTKCELHPLFEGNYESTPFAYKGILTAAWPWSGHYRIESGLWIVSHFTQFANPGWQYVDSGCIEEEQFCCITLQNPQTGDISVILLNGEDHPLEIKISFQMLMPSCLHVWRSDAESQMAPLDDVLVTNSNTPIVLSPFSLYSLTTTTGQKKGKPVYPLLQKTEFHLPYYDDFSGYRTGENPRYTLDQGGAFEICRLKSGKNYLRQAITQKTKPKDWARRKTPEPYTLMGSLEWANYSVKVSVGFDYPESYAMIGGRVNLAPKSGNFPCGYCFLLYGNGRWELKKAETVLQAGSAANWDMRENQKMEIIFTDDLISAYWNRTLLCSVHNQDFFSGQAVFGSGYQSVRFYSFAVENSSQELPVSCKRVDDRDARIVYTDGFMAQSAGYEVYFRSLTTASSAGEQMRFTFVGCAVGIIAQKGKEGGMASVSIDGNFVRDIDTYCPVERNRESVFSAYHLSKGMHTLILTVKKEHNISSAGTKLNIDALEYH